MYPVARFLYSFLSGIEYNLLINTKGEEAMKKIAFIDLFIDEWHSNHYPAWFAQAARAKDFEIACAWEEHSFPGRRTLEQWCADMQIAPAPSLREAVDCCDCICVLAPANPEAHARLAEYALSTGKPVYIDKPFAPSRKEAERLFALAGKYRTPLMSSSALRFADELIRGDVQAAMPEILTTTGGGRSFREYAIHQFEMIVSVLGTEVENLRFSGDAETAVVILEYSGGRRAVLSYKSSYPFSLTAASRGKAFVFPELHHYFENLTESILDFFATGKSVVPQEETLAVADLLERSVLRIGNGPVQN